MILFDTNILIYALQKNHHALDFFDDVRRVPYISAMTVMELYGGVKTASERMEVLCFFEL